MKIMDKIKQLRNKNKKQTINTSASSMSIQNLKVFNIKKRGKYSLKKIATIGLSIAIASSVILNGCVEQKNMYNPPQATPYVQEITNSSEITEEITGKKIVSSFEETPISYTDEANLIFNEYLQNFDVEFATIEEIYNIDAASDFIRAGRANIENHQYSGFIVDGKVDESKLLESIITNSPIYKKENKEKTLFYQPIDNRKLLQQIVAIIADSLNNDLPSKTEEDIRELDCTLGSLRVFTATGLSAAAITDDNVLLINEPMIKMLEINSGNDDGLRHTIYHESKHLEQVSCNDYDNEPYEYQGISIKTDNLEYNPYSWTWITEGSAEKGSTNQIGGNDEAYINLVAYTESLDLASILSPYAKDGNDIENCTFNKNMNHFYELLGETKAISRKEIVEMMYAMEIVQKKVTTYQEEYAQKFKEELSDQDYMKIRYQLRRDFILETAKIFYSNLANAINNRNDVTLEDIFFLITIFEGDMNYHLEYSTSKTTSLDDETKKFLTQYNELQTNFFSSLSICNNLTIDDVMLLYNEYGMYAQTNDTSNAYNASLKWISDEKRKWLETKAEGTRILYGLTIQQIINNPEMQIKRP